MSRIILQSDTENWHYVYLHDNQILTGETIRRDFVNECSTSIRDYLDNLYPGVPVMRAYQIIYERRQ